MAINIQKLADFIKEKGSLFIVFGVFIAFFFYTPQIFNMSNENIPDLSENDKKSIDYIKSNTSTVILAILIILSITILKELNDNLKDDYLEFAFKISFLILAFFISGFFFILHRIQIISLLYFGSMIYLVHLSKNTIENFWKGKWRENVKVNLLLSILSTIYVMIYLKYQSYIFSKYIFPKDFIIILIILVITLDIIVYIFYPSSVFTLERFSDYLKKSLKEKLKVYKNGKTTRK